MQEKERPESFEQTLETYVRIAKDELTQRWKNWELDLSEQEKFEVVGALLARQVSLATELTLSPNIWNQHIAPLILRSMVDNYINLAWILGDVLERSRKFILYGLGQEKLQLEHLKVQIEKEGDNPEENKFVEMKERWINAQRYTFLTEVIIGSWSGIDTRKMAEEADCIDDYNYFYQPLSSTAHNMWNHVGKINLRVCENPLHKFHLVPDVPELEPNLYFLVESSKLLAKTFDVFDEKTNNNQKPSSAKDYLSNFIAE